MQVVIALRKKIKQGHYKDFVFFSERNGRSLGACRSKQGHGPISVNRESLWLLDGELAIGGLVLIITFP